MSTSVHGSSSDYAVIETLRDTDAIIWQEADRYTKVQLLSSFALLVLGSVLGALLPVVYKLIMCSAAPCCLQLG